MEDSGSGDDPLRGDFFLLKDDVFFLIFPISQNRGSQKREDFLRFYKKAA